MAKRSQPTFRVVLSGISPDDVGVRTVADILQSVQRLVANTDEPRDEDEPDREAVDDVRLTSVKCGSAVYECLAANPKAALSRLQTVGTTIDAPSDASGASLVNILYPLRDLSKLAESLGSTIRIIDKSTNRSLVEINGNSYENIAAHVLKEGESQVVGRIERVGGATEQRCALRIPGRARLLYCRVSSTELARELGKSLYSRVVAKGQATWIYPSWHILEFRINAFRDLAEPDYRGTFAKLRAMGAAKMPLKEAESIVRGFRE